MGSLLSSNLVDAEKTSWVKPHSLAYNEVLRKEQLKLLPKFKRKLELCYAFINKSGVRYQHWWITDGKWIIEIGDADVKNQIIVHCNPRKEKSVTDSNFVLNDEVMERMKNVCGATNYSMALRNCEHMARYIHCGAWISFQMVGDGVLKEIFFSHMSQFTKIVNTLPVELIPEEREKIPLYLDKDEESATETGFIEWTGMKEAFNSSDEEDYNIVFIGPTGAGKSHLINNLFNLTVCTSGASLDSVTKEVRFYEGKARIFTHNYKTKKREVLNKTINVIDTIGFCDTLLSPSDVLEAIKSSVKVNISYIDKVVVVCSGRLEPGHATAIESFLNWLNFTKYRSQFVFVYNKCDLISLRDRHTNLLRMCEKFDVKTFQTMVWTKENGDIVSIKSNLALGFPPQARFADVASDYADFTRAILATGPKVNEKRRIPVKKSFCTIL